MLPVHGVYFGAYSAALILVVFLHSCVLRGYSSPLLCRGQPLSITFVPICNLTIHPPPCPRRADCCLYRGPLSCPALLPSPRSTQLTMAFGIRNVPDRLKALKEFSRILARPAPSTGTEPASAGGLSGGAGVAGEEGTGPSASSSASVVAILELQNPESGLLASASRTFIKCAVFFVAFDIL